MTVFVLPVKITFQHCDPAGIVFYPRYFEMINQTVESWFEEGLSYPFARMQFEDGRGVPCVTIRADFTAPSRLGDRLDFRLCVLKVGRTSVGLSLVAVAEGKTRLGAELTIVHIDKASGRPVAWDEAVSERMRGFSDDRKSAPA